jgi:hypothetical protein
MEIGSSRTKWELPAVAAWAPTNFRLSLRLAHPEKMEKNRLLTSACDKPNTPAP